MRVPLPNGATLWLRPLAMAASNVVPSPTDAGWVQVAKVTGLTPSGGSERYEAHRPLGSYEDVRSPSGRDSIDIEVQYQDAPTSPHHQAIKLARDTRQALGWMIKLRSGGVVMFVGYPGGNMLPALDRNELMVIAITIAVTVEPHRIPA